VTRAGAVVIDNPLRWPAMASASPHTDGRVDWASAWKKRPGATRLLRSTTQPLNVCSDPPWPPCGCSVPACASRCCVAGQALCRTAAESLNTRERETAPAAPLALEASNRLFRA
jgi:hypothetical protein